MITSTVNLDSVKKSIIDDVLQSDLEKMTTDEINLRLDKISELLHYIPQERDFLHKLLETKNRENYEKKLAAERLEQEAKEKREDVVAAEEALKDGIDSNESSMTNLLEEDFEDTAAWNKYKAEKDAHEAKRAKKEGKPQAGV